MKPCAIKPFLVSDRHRPLGKLAPKRDRRTLKLSHYVHKVDIPVEPRADWRARGVISSWPMFLNDKIGCCTIASGAHMIEAWSASARGLEADITEADVLAAYEEACGYDPADPTSDQGGVEIDVLNYWRKVGIGGHKIGAYASINPDDPDMIRRAIALFGGVYTGFALPLSAQDQPVWKSPVRGTRGHGAPGSWGGHAVPIQAYDPHLLTCITWGGEKAMSWQFLADYCDEVYAIISPDFLRGSRMAPNGFDVAKLVADLTVIAETPPLPASI